MSYCRGPYPYAWADVVGGIFCAAENPDHWKFSHELFHTHHRTEMIRHLTEHLTRGDKVPKYALRRLVDEIVDQGNDC